MTNSDIDILFQKLDNMRISGALFDDLSNEEKSLLKTAEDNSRIKALYYLGRCSLDEDWGPEGWRYIKEAEAGGLPAAQCMVANGKFWNLFRRDDPGAVGDIPIPSDVLNLWKQSSEAGDYEAKYMLAEYANMNDAESLHMLLESADAGYHAAYSALGQRYYWGWGVSQDFVTAAKYFENAFQAAAEPLSEAIPMAIIYMEGQGVNKDIAKAMEYLNALLKDRINNKNTYIPGELYEQLARTYLVGDVAEQALHQRIIKSLYWYCYSMELGYLPAASYVVCILEQICNRWQSKESRDNIINYACKRAKRCHTFTSMGEYGEEDIERNYESVVADVEHWCKK